MDENIDRAQTEILSSISEAMRQRKPEGPMPTGKCLWCDTPVSQGARWCGTECRDEWEHHTHHKLKTVKRKH